MSEQYVETVIIGAGPVGLFQIFELGLLGISTHIIDSLGQPGGQCTELYPDKPIYDIPALPVCGAQELIDRLLEQAKPFKATFHLGQEVTELRVLEQRQISRCDLHRYPPDRGRGGHRGRSGFLSGPASRRSRRRAIRRQNGSLPGEVGGRFFQPGPGDLRRRGLGIGLDGCVLRQGALLDLGTSTRGLSGRARHGRTHARLGRGGQMQFLQGNAVALHKDGEKLTGLEVQTADGQMRTIPVDHVFAFFGLHPKLGPIAEWGLEMEKRALKVDTEKFQTSIPGIFAIGDINSYPGKKKLILSGFHEAALTAFAIQHHLFPEKRQFLQYTTTSPIMQKRLGVAGTDS